MSFTLVYIGKSLHEMLEKKSLCEMEMFGGCEIYMPDGFYYRCMLNSIGDSETKGVDGKFSNGLAFPGDPNGRPEEVYQCRCTMAARVLGFRKER
mgnify:CR=1 FL=1